MLDKETAYKDPFRYLQQHVGHKVQFQNDMNKYVHGDSWRKVYFEFADRATIPYIKGQEMRLVRESINLMKMMEPDRDLSKSIPFPESDILMTLPDLNQLEDMRIALPNKFDDLLTNLLEDFFDKWNRWNVPIEQ